jgi:hypothetical protein
MFLDKIVEGRKNFRRNICREIFILGCWAIWIHRNEVIFDDVRVSLGRWSRSSSQVGLLLHRAKPNINWSYKIGCVIFLRAYFVFNLGLRSCNLYINSENEKLPVHFKKKHDYERLDPLHDNQT